MSDPQVRLIQIDSSCSRTAARAWQWIPIRDGSDFALASGLARVLVEQNLVPAHVPVPAMSMTEAADQSGLSVLAIEDLARTLVARTPVLAIARDNNPAVAALNIMLGSVGTRGGIVRRSQSKQTYLSADGAIPNARALLIDSSVPWDFAPQTDAEVFRFAAWDGGPTRADWLLPAPGFLEELTDVPTAPTSSVETYALASTLAKPSSEAYSAVKFLGRLDSSLTSPEKVIHTRCEELLRKHSGILCGKEQTPITQIGSVQKLEEQLWNGVVWMAEPSAPGNLQAELKQWPDPVYGARSSACTSDWNVSVMPPLASKLYIESGLRQGTERRNA